MTFEVQTNFINFRIARGAYCLGSNAGGRGAAAGLRAWWAVLRGGEAKAWDCAAFTVGSPRTRTRCQGAWQRFPREHVPWQDSEAAAHRASFRTALPGQAGALAGPGRLRAAGWSQADEDSLFRQL